MPKKISLNIEGIDLARLKDVSAVMKMILESKQDQSTMQCALTVLGQLVQLPANRISHCTFKA